MRTLSKKACKAIARTLWWAGRVGAAALVVLVIVLAIGGGLPNPSALSLSVVAQFAMLAGIMLGLLLGMVRPLAGVLSVLMCVAGFDTINLATTGALAGPWIHAFAGPAILYLVSAGLQHASFHANNATA